MIPRFTKVEISKRIQKEINKSELDIDIYAKKYNYNLDTLHKLLNPSLIWIAQDYQLASKIIDIAPEQLLEQLPQEELDSISFRALDNTDEINQKVRQLDDIFQLLTYQLKIGSELHD